MVNCPRCGIPGLLIEGEIYKCWSCTVTAKAPPHWDRCGCDCPACEDCAPEVEFDPRDRLIESIRKQLPRGYELPDFDWDDDVTPVTAALIYTADGRVLTEVSP